MSFLLWTAELANVEVWTKMVSLRQSHIHNVTTSIWLYVFISFVLFVGIYNTEFVMTGVLRQKLEYNVYPLTVLYCRVCVCVCACVRACVSHLHWDRVDVLFTTSSQNGCSTCSFVILCIDNSTLTFKSLYRNRMKPTGKKNPIQWKYFNQEMIILKVLLNTLN